MQLKVPQTNIVQASRLLDACSRIWATCLRLSAKSASDGIGDLLIELVRGWLQGVATSARLAIIPSRSGRQSARPQDCSRVSAVKRS